MFGNISLFYISHNHTIYYGAKILRYGQGFILICFYCIIFKRWLYRLFI